MRLKVYGKAKRGHREKHFVKKENAYRYREVRRDKKGRFMSRPEAWSSKKPIGKAKYQEWFFEAETGKEAKEQIREFYRSVEWVDFDVES